MRKKGFTLVELMVVVLIVGILAAVAMPMMRGRIDAAKWSEGRAGAGTIATALRAYAAEHDTLDGVTLGKLGFADGDFAGTYFDALSYQIGSDAAPKYDPDDGVSFVITITNLDLKPTTMTLTVDKGAGSWD